MTRTNFLRYVQAYIESDPEAAAHVANYVQKGLSAALSKSNERAADMEAALLTAMMQRKNVKTAPLVLERLLKWRGKTSLKWDWFFEREKV